MSAAIHIPVLAAEVVAGLQPRDGGIYLDGTFGAGGYSRRLLLAAACRVLGIDRDPAALVRGAALVQEFPGRIDLLAGCFGDMEQLAARVGVGALDGVTLDLGVSSPQIDDAGRGFSFRADGPLDMRMGGDGKSAADLVADLSETELADLIYAFGEERHSRRVARTIVAARAEAPITRTLQLAEIVRRAVPRSADGIDPATRTFQALRIAVNDELGELERGLAAAERLLRPAGRIAVVAFHSLEDRAVKRYFAAAAGDGGQSRHLPGLPPVPRRLRLITRRPILPGPAELAANPRARSARLRIAEKLEAVS